MITAVIPKLPMRVKSITKDFYINQFGFKDIGVQDYAQYLLLRKDEIELHFFEYQDLDINTNYGQIYIRSNNIEDLFKGILNRGGIIHPNGNLQSKPWGQKEFSMLDPDNNLITFGQAI